MSATGSFLVKTANKANATSLAKCIPTELTCKNNRYVPVVKSASELSKQERDQCWDLFALNMQDFYRSSDMGWDPEKKQKELFHRLSRFVLVYSAGDLPAFVAFTMFRFEYENGYNLIYCYELQVSPTAKRRGLGKALMDQLKSLGKKYAMDKAMLTVFKGNSQAVEFYTHYGFASDPSCPGYVEEDPSVDYRILSLEI